MRIAIVGSRPPVTRFTTEHARYERLLARVDEYVATLERDTIVVTGGARGVDTHALQAAKRHGMRVMVFYPNWERGRGAGYARNVSIVRNSDAVAAFWDGASKGTRHTIGVAMDASIPTLTYTPEGVDDALTNTTMRFFPRMWGNPSAHTPVVPAPLGSMCMGCDRAIGERDEGLTMPLVAGPSDPARVAWHRECWINSIMGPPFPRVLTDES